MSDGELKTRPLRRSDWQVIERLFGPNGACGGCWCMFWRVERGGKAWAAQKGAVNRRRFRRLIESGAARGVLAFAGRDPVGWCSVAPKRDFAYFARSRSFEPSDDPAVWSVTCFYVPARWRRRGVAAALLEAAVRYARERGARRLEGYPVVPRGDAPMAAGFAWTGVPALFEAARFRREPGRGARPLYVREL